MSGSIDGELMHLWQLDIVQGLCKHYMYTRDLKLQLVTSLDIHENIMLSTSSLLH
jgi:hypothetical protein